MTRTNEKISKSYLSKVKNDIDRKNPRHGLACEYVFEKLREKQFLKEIVWLYQNLRKEYKRRVRPLIKEKIWKIKGCYEMIEIRKKNIDDSQIDLSNFVNAEDHADFYRKEDVLRKIRSYKQEIQEQSILISILKNDIKLIFECRSEIFDLLNSISLGLMKDKNNFFLVDFQKNIYNKIIIPSFCIEKPINSISMAGNRTNSIIAFADIFIPYSGLDKIEINIRDSYSSKRYVGDSVFYISLITNINNYLTGKKVKNTRWGDPNDFYWDIWTNSTLGEVKIAKQESEEVLQQINLYHELVFPTKTYVCLDYEDTQLLGLTKDSKIQVLRLGSGFQDFCDNRPDQKLEEI